MKYYILYLFSLIVFLKAQNYRGAELRTKADFLYGKFEVRFKPAQGDGLVSSFFFYNTVYGNTPWN